MSTDPDRDLSDDRLLRAALTPAPPAGGDACLDAETLAAWADGSLPAPVTSDIDRHLATCERCQAVMAAFATIDVDEASGAPAAAAPAVVVPFRPRSPLRWIIPAAVGTIAASLIIWTAWPQSVSTPLAEESRAKLEPPPIAAALPTQVEPAKSNSVVAANEGRQAARVAPALQGQQGHAETKVAPAQPPVATPVTTATGAIAIPPASTTALPPPPPASLPVNPPAAAGAAAAARPEIVMLRSAADSTRAEAADAKDSRVVAEFAPVTATASGLAQPFVTSGRAGGAGGGGRGGGGGGRVTPAPERTAPRLRWRVLGSGKVEKTTNGGDTWDPVALGPPAIILNGAAPSASVCWLVGRAGIVLLSTDGVKFTRVMFPDLSDLRSITAVDARQASITTTDGRVFETADAGETWTLKNG